MLGEPLQSPKSYIIALNNQFLDRPKKKKNSNNSKQNKKNYWKNINKKKINE